MWIGGVCGWVVCVDGWCVWMGGMRDNVGWYEGLM